MIRQSTLNQFYSSCQTVIAAARMSPQAANLGFAASYARAGQQMHDANSIYTQACYIRANLSGWRGNEARATREIFDGLIKELERATA